MFGARSTVIPLDSTCHQNDAKNDSLLQSHQGALSFRLAWPGAYKMPLLPLSHILLVLSSSPAPAPQVDLDNLVARVLRLQPCTFILAFH
jgi:dihydroorotase-like cyclic amidohydrolase